MAEDGLGLTAEWLTRDERVGSSVGGSLSLKTIIGGRTWGISCMYSLSCLVNGSRVGASNKHEEDSIL